jgi:hypothetical protein
MAIFAVAIFVLNTVSFAGPFTRINEFRLLVSMNIVSKRGKNSAALLAE